MKSLTTSVACVATLSAFVILWGRAEAGIVSTSGDVEIINPPPSVLEAALEDPSLTRVFQEQTSHELAADLTVNMNAPGTFTAPADLPVLTLTIPAGTVVDSYLFHFDYEVNNTVRESVGSVTFDRPILGVIGRLSDLVASDAELGAPGTSYSTLATSGIWDSQDSVTLSSDLRTLSFDLTMGGKVDDLRVVTQAVPEPSSLALSTLALAGCLAFQICLRRFAQVASSQPPIPNP